jgi:hypothetical protein
MEAAMAESVQPQMVIDPTASHEQRAALMAFECVAPEFSGSQIVAALHITSITSQHPELVGEVITLITDERDKTEALFAACRSIIDTGAFQVVSEYDAGTEGAMFKDRTYRDLRAALDNITPILARDPNRVAAHKEKIRRELAKRSFEIFAGRLVKQEVEVESVERENESFDEAV